MSNVVRGGFVHRSCTPVKSGNTPTGGDGGGSGMLERVVRLESDVEYIRRDMAEVKDATNILMADTTDIKVRLEKMSGRQDLFESKLDNLESKLDAMDKKFEAKFDAMDKKFDAKFDAADKKSDAKFDAADKKFATKADLHEALSKQQQWMFRTMLTIMGIGVTLTGVVVGLLITYLPKVP